MAFIDDLRTGTGITDNGAATNLSSLNSVVDFLFFVGSSRNIPEETILSIFSKSFVQDPLSTIRILFWARDVRGGAGERKVFRYLLRYLAFNHPEIVKKNINSIPYYGRWDDMLELYGSPVWKLAVKTIQIGLYTGDGLCSKWMPRKGMMSRILRKELDLSPKQYRKLLVNNTRVVESEMCSKKWDEINFSSVPSLASARYANCFRKRTPEKYENWIKDVQSGVSKINTTTVFPHDVVKMLKNGDTTAANTMWDELPDFLGTRSQSILPVVDTSGSMNSQIKGSQNLRFIDVSISLGLYLSGKIEGDFKDCFITFSENPHLEVLKGNLNEKYIQLEKANWGMNTNLEKVFSLILEAANRNSTPQQDMPGTILIISDMQFDICIKTSNTLLEDIQNKYKQSGYQMPKVIFWNLNSKPGNIPATFNQMGVSLISGFSPSILKFVLSTENMSPVNVLNSIVDSQRYSQISI